MTILFVNSLTVIDASLLHPVRGLLGESWEANIELEGELDEQGMVLDFGLVKAQVKHCIDQYFDHRLLLPTRHPGCHIDPDGEGVEIRFRLDSGETIVHRSPEQAIAKIETDEITDAALSAAIEELIRPTLPDNVRQIRLHLHHERITGAWYQYSHGLKRHTGNCQRIAHGHRSRIRIFQDGERARDLEAAWAERWRDIYIGTAEDLREELKQESIDCYRFAYRADQGRFELILPKASCYLIKNDSTVENLARHIATTLHQACPGSAFRVQAFEGVGKGAVAEA